MADSKALRFSQMVQALKERLSSEGEQRSHLEQENERLQKEVDRVKVSYYSVGNIRMKLTSLFYIIGTP